MRGTAGGSDYWTRMHAGDDHINRALLPTTTSTTGSTGSTDGDHGGSSEGGADFVSLQASSPGVLRGRWGTSMWCQYTGGSRVTPSGKRTPGKPLAFIFGGAVWDFGLYGTPNVTAIAAAAAAAAAAKNNSNSSNNSGNTSGSGSGSGSGHGTNMNLSHTSLETSFRGMYNSNSGAAEKAAAAAVAVAAAASSNTSGTAAAAGGGAGLGGGMVNTSTGSLLGIPSAVGDHIVSNELWVYEFSNGSIGNGNIWKDYSNVR